MKAYATDEERAAWEAAGRPLLDPAAWAQVLDEFYAGGVQAAHPAPADWQPGDPPYQVIVVRSDEG